MSLVMLSMIGFISLAQAEEVGSMPQEDMIVDARSAPPCFLAPLATAVVRGKVTAIGSVVTVREGAYLGGVFTKFSVTVTSTLKGSKIPSTLTVYGAGRIRGDVLLGGVPLASLIANGTDVILYLAKTEGRWYVRAGGGFYWSLGDSQWRNEMSAAQINESVIYASVGPGGGCL